MYFSPVCFFTQPYFLEIAPRTCIDIFSVPFMVPQHSTLCMYYSSFSQLHWIEIWAGFGLILLYTLFQRIDNLMYYCIFCIHIFVFFVMHLQDRFIEVVKIAKKVNAHIILLHVVKFYSVIVVLQNTTPISNSRLSFPHSVAKKYLSNVVYYQTDK